MPLPEGAIAVETEPAGLPAGAIPVEADDDANFGVGKFVDRIVRGIAQGITFGYGDEIAAFARSQTEGVPYEQALAEERGKDREFSDRFPVTSAGANIVGAVASPAAKLAAPVKGAGLLAQTGRGAAAGAGMGAVAGSGYADGDAGDRIEGALTGAVVGGVAGAAAPTVVQIAGAGLRRLGRIVTGRTGTEAEAARKVLKALQDDRVDAATAVKRLRELGPEAGLADIGEENVRGVARAAAGTPGPARTVAKDFLQNRQLGQSGRIVEKAQSAFGEFRKYAQSADDLIEARAAAAAPRYKAAYQTEVPFTDELADILQTDAGKRALAVAKRIASNEGRKLPEIISRADDGTAKINVEAVPDMRAWDIIKRAFDSVLNRHRNQLTGKLDLSDPMARSVNDVRGRLVAELDRLNPAYAEARAVFAGPAQALDAMQRGRAFLKGDADITKKVIEGMSPAERDFFRLGVVRGIQDVVENTRDVTDVTGRLFGSQTMRDKLRAVFPNTKAYAEFEKFMKAEATMAETRRVVLGGSPTARIQAEQSELMRMGDAAADAVLGSPVQAIRQALANLKAGLDPEVSERLGALLFTKGGEINEEAIRKLFRFERLEGVPPEIQQQLVRSLVAGSAVGGAEATRPDIEVRFGPEIRK